MPRRREQPVATNDLLVQLAAGLSTSARKPNNLMYRPHEKQIIFHSSVRKSKQYLGGNRSGKTTGGINEDIWWLRGEHPYRKVPEPPVVGRITTVDFKNGAEKIIIPNLKQWIPPSLLINGSWEDSYDKSKHVLHCANDSELEIMSYDQELEKFAGVPRHFTHFDEEPPKDIFEECKARLVDYNGSWWMTMTPVEGMTWTYDEIYLPWESGDEQIEIIQVNITDNPYISKEGIVELLKGYAHDEDQVSIRGTGKYVAVSGLVFKHYDPEVHVIRSTIPPANWTHYISLDAGYNNPTAVLFHAVSPEGDVITYKEHYKREWTVAQHAEQIKAMEANLRENHGIVPFLRVADPAIKQRQQTTGLSVQIEYSQLGINFATSKTRDVNAGLDKMNNYLRTRKWFITEDCPNFQKEIRKYKRGDYATARLRQKNNRKEEPQKKDDHACDSARYFFSYMPDLNVEDLLKKPLRNPSDVASMVLGARDGRRATNIDFGLFLNVGSQQSYDSTVGEY